LLKANKFHIWQIAGSLYFGQENLKTLPALFIGAMTHTSIMALAGVIICFMLYYTGRDYYLIKGFGVLMMFWIFLFGIVLRLGIARIKPVDAGTNLAHFIGHASAGLIISYLIVKLADNKAWNEESNTNIEPPSSIKLRKFYLSPAPARKREQKETKIHFVRPKKL
jgi:hypothetical protein